MSPRASLRSLLCSHSGTPAHPLIHEAPWPVPFACLLVEELFPDPASPAELSFWALLAGLSGFILLAVGLCWRCSLAPSPLHSVCAAVPPDAADPASATPDTHEIPPGWRGSALYFCIGLFAGTFGSAVGLGGGVLIVPTLVSLGMQQARAHGTSLVSVTATSITGAYAYLAAGFVERTAATLLALTAIPMAGVGAYCANKMRGYKLKRFFGGWLLMASSLILLKPYLPVLYDLTAAAATGGVRYCLAVGCLGLAGGFFSAFLGVGGGSLLVPCLALSGFPQHIAQGTALCSMVLPSLFGCTQHHRRGNVAWRLAPFLVVGGFCGGVAGGHLAVYLPEQALRGVFSVGLAAIGVRYVLA